MVTVLAKYWLPLLLPACKNASHHNITPYSYRKKAKRDENDCKKKKKKKWIQNTTTDLKNYFGDEVKNKLRLKFKVKKIEEVNAVHMCLFLFSS